MIALPNINIAEGTNVSIKNADIIYSKVSSIPSADAGVEYQKKWLENLVLTLEAILCIDVGYFEPKPKTRFEECVGNMLNPNRTS